MTRVIHLTKAWRATNGLLGHWLIPGFGRWVRVMALLGLVSLILSCGRGLRENLVDYGYTVYNEFGNMANVGKVIPLTIGKSAEIDGSVSPDERFLYYASNQQGNFNIYVRSLGDIVKKPITEHAAADTSPRISPDGEKLIFVSMRDDHKGDILAVEADPESWLTSEGKAIDEFGGDSNLGELVNLTEKRNERNIRLSITDKDPVWSPNGKFIAFVSDRGPQGQENIWMMTPDGEKMWQVTQKGGIQPKFSPDGHKIIYVSYRDHELGEIYELALNQAGRTAGQPERLTDNQTIELYPSYLKKTSEIVYTRIDRDTNDNGKLDLEDSTQLWYWNRQNQRTYPMTTDDSSSFNVAYYPDLFDRGPIVLYTSSQDDNLNVSMVPRTGIIPKRKNISSQYHLAQQYLEEYGDEERYILGLRRTMDFHAGSRLDYIFIPLAFLDIVDYYVERGQRDKALSHLKELDEFGRSQTKGKGRIYQIIAQAKQKSLQGQDSVSYLRRQIKIFAEENKENIHENKIVPFKLYSKRPKPGKLTPEMNQLAFLHEVLGDLYVDNKAYRKARQSYGEALKVHRRYALYYPLLVKMGKVAYDNFARYYRQDKLPRSWKYLYLEDRARSQIADVNEWIIERYQKEKNPRRGLNKIERFYKRYKSSKNIGKLYRFVANTFRIEMEQYQKALKGFRQVLKQSHKTENMHFSTLYYLGRTHELLGQKEQMEKLFMRAIKGYSRSFRNPLYHTMKYKLVEYYERKGKSYELAGKWPKAAQLYSRWVELMSELNMMALSQKLYQEKGVTAHIRYIDAKLRALDHDETQIQAFIEEYNKDKNIDLARVTYNKAYLFGAAYLYQRLALIIDWKYRRGKEQGAVGLNPLASINDFLTNMQKAEDELKWVSYMDEEFLEAYLLQGFIYSFVDVRRQQDGHSYGDVYKKYFPDFLLEQTVSIYRKALRINDETRFPNQEGNFYLNLGNSYYLLRNFPKALSQYQKVLEYKNLFDSPTQEGLFYFHLAYSYWQSGDSKKAEKYLVRVEEIYRDQWNKSQGARRKRLKQTLMRIDQYRAMIKRVQGDYDSAVSLYKKLLAQIDRGARKQWHYDRIQQEMAYSYYQMGRHRRSLYHLKLAQRFIERHGESESVRYPLRLRVLNIKNKLVYNFDTGFVVPFLLPNLAILNIADPRGIGVWDMGEDSAVIGDSRIFRTLQKDEKVSLNLSLYGYNYRDKGDVDESLEILHKKWQNLEDPQTQFDWQVKAVTGNNLGFYYFQKGKYLKAKEYFKKTSDILSGDDYRNFEADLKNRFNYLMVNFYILENRPDLVDSPRRLVEQSLSFIHDYEKEYKKGILAESIAKEEAKLKARKKEMTENDKKRVEKKVDDKVAVALFKLKMYEANLLFYKANLEHRDRLTAEQKDQSDKQQKNKDEAKAKQSPQQQDYQNISAEQSKWRKHYGYYERAYQKFSELVDIYQTRGDYADVTPLPDSIRQDKRMEAVLYSNHGQVAARMGRHLDALRHYFHALRIAREYHYREILVPLELFIGKTLARAPKVAQYIANHQEELGEDFFQVSVSPLEHVNRAQKMLWSDSVLAYKLYPYIDRVYQTLVGYYVNERKEPDRALTILEQGEQLKRRAQLTQLQPKLAEAEANEMLQRLLSSQKQRFEIDKKLSDAQENSGQEGLTVAELRKKRQQLTKQLKVYQRQILKEHPRLRAFVPHKVDLQVEPDRFYVRFFVKGRQLYTWFIVKSNRRFLTKTFNAKALDDNIKRGNWGAIAQYLFREMPKQAQSYGDWIVVPDGPLWQVPFGRMPLAKETGEAPSLGSKHSLRYVPSLAVASNFSRRNEIFRHHYLAVGSIDPIKEKEGRGRSFEVAHKKSPAKAQGVNGDILDIPAAIAPRTALAMSVRPSLAMVDLSSQSAQEWERQISLWTAIGQIWQVTNILFYRGLSPQDKNNLVQNYIQAGLDRVLLRTRLSGAGTQGGQGQEDKSKQNKALSMWLGNSKLTGTIAARQNRHLGRLMDGVRRSVVEGAPRQALSSIAKGRNFARALLSDKEKELPWSEKYLSAFWPVHKVKALAWKRDADKQLQAATKGMNLLTSFAQVGYDGLSPKEKAEARQWLRYMAVAKFRLLQQIQGEKQAHAFAEKIVAAHPKSPVAGDLKLAKALLRFERDHRVAWRQEAPSGKDSNQAKEDDNNEEGSQNSSVSKTNQDKLTVSSAQRRARSRQGLNSALQKWQEDEPNSYLYGEVAEALAGAGRFAQARRYYQEALKLATNEYARHRLRGRLFVWSRRFGQAVAAQIRRDWRGHYRESSVKKYHYMSVATLLAQKGEAQAHVRQVNDYLSVSSEYLPRELVRQLELDKALVLARLGKNQEVIQILKSEAFATEGARSLWFERKRLLLLQQSYAATQQTGEELAILPSLIALDGSMGNDKHLLSAYQRRLSLLFGRQSYQKILQEMADLEPRLTKDHGLAGSRTYGELLLLATDAAYQEGKDQLFGRYRKKARQHGRIAGWRLKLRATDATARQKEWEQAMRGYERLLSLVRRKGLERRDDFSRDVNHLYQQLIAVYREVGQDRKLLDLMNSYYRWKYQREPTPR